MIPCNNPEKFTQKYGEWWYIRPFDYLPEPLKYFNMNISNDFMAEVHNRTFELFKTKEEAMEVSYSIRKDRGMKLFTFDRNVIYCHELEERARRI